MQHHNDSYGEPSSNRGADWDRLNRKLRKQKEKFDKLSRAFEKVSLQNQNSSTNSRDERGRSLVHISRDSSSSNSSSSSRSSPSPSPVRRHKSHTSRRSIKDEIRSVLAEERKRGARIDRMQRENAVTLNENNSMNNLVNNPVMVQMADTANAILEMLKKHEKEIKKLKKECKRRSDSNPEPTGNTYNTYNDYSQTYNDEGFHLSLGLGGGLGGLLPGLFGLGSRSGLQGIPGPSRPSLRPSPYPKLV